MLRRHDMLRQLMRLVQHEGRVIVGGFIGAGQAHDSAFFDWRVLSVDIVNDLEVPVHMVIGSSAEKIVVAQEDHQTFEFTSVEGAQAGVPSNILQQGLGTGLCYSVR